MELVSLSQNQPEARDSKTYADKTVRTILGTMTSISGSSALSLAAEREPSSLLYSSIDPPPPRHQSPAPATKNQYKNDHTIHAHHIIPVYC